MSTLMTEVIELKPARRAVRATVYHVTLSVDEAKALAAVLYRLSGHLTASRRKHLTGLAEQLQIQFNLSLDKDVDGGIRFKQGWESDNDKV